MNSGCVLLAALPAAALLIGVGTQGFASASSWLRVSWLLVGWRLTMTHVRAQYKGTDLRASLPPTRETPYAFDAPELVFSFYLERPNHSSELSELRAAHTARREGEYLIIVSACADGVPDLR